MTFGALPVTVRALPAAVAPFRRPSRPPGDRPGQAAGGGPKAATAMPIAVALASFPFASVAPTL